MPILSHVDFRRGSIAPVSTKLIVVISHACVRSANREIYRKLSARGFNIRLLVPQRIKKGGKWIAAEEVVSGDPEITMLPLRGRNIRLFRYVGLTETLDALRPAVVIAESDPASLIAISAGRWCKKNYSKLFCVTNENLAWSWRSAVRRGGLKELPAALLKSAMHASNRSRVAHVFTTSDDAVNVFAQAGFPSVSKIPLGTDRVLFKYSSKIRRAAREELGFADGEIAIAYFGRMVPEKGVDTLIDALGMLLDLPWRLVLNEFESTSSYAKRIDNLLCERGLGDRVVRLQARHGEIARMMVATDVVVLPSRTTAKWVEQFGRVVAEGMSCGNLLIVSDSGAPKELVPSLATVFPEGDATALARLLRHFFEDAQGAVSLRRAGMRRAHVYLSIEAQTIEITKQLDRVLSADTGAGN